MTSATRLAAAPAAHPFAPGRARAGPAQPTLTGGDGWRLGYLRRWPLA